MSVPPFHLEQDGRIEPAPWVPHAPVVILGAGIAANSAAWHLTRHGVAPVVLMPRADLLDASTRGLGLLIPGHGEDPARLARALSIDGMAELYHFSLEAIRMVASGALEVSCDFNATPALMLSRRALEAADLEASVDLLAGVGLDAELMEAGQVSTLAGPGFRNGLWWPEAGLIDPVKLNTGLAQGAAARGAAYQPGVEVLEVRDAADRLVIETSRGRVTAELLIHAGGVDARRTCPFLQPTLLTARVQHLATLPGAPCPTIPATASSGFEYWRPGPAGGVWLGGFRYLSEELGLLLKEEGLDPVVTARHEAVVSLLCAGETPAISHRWSRFLDLSCDNLPLVGPVPGQPRQLVLTGFAGHESTLGLLAARSLVETMLELPMTTPLPATFSPRRML